MAVREFVVAAVDDLAEGEMKTVSVQQREVLLIRTANGFNAIGPKCTHYGAPLEDGVLIGNRVICPWHKTCFRVTDGRVLAPPALDDLPSYAVRVEDGNVLVMMPDHGPEEMRPVVGDAAAAPDERVFVIVGAGGAGAAAAEELRVGGFRGRIVMIGLEERPPYDRTKLSKPFLAGQQGLDELPIRPDDYYDRHRIERMTGVVERIDTERREVTFADESSPLKADGLLIATGGAPKQLDVPGADFPNALTLRDVDDAVAITRMARERAQVVVIGNGFIGMEAAASLTTRGCTVTLVGRSDVPLASVVGEKIGQALRRLHESKGVTFVTGEVERFDGDGAVETVVLADGQQLPADIVIVAIGVSPATDIVSGIERQGDGGLPVDEHLKASGGVWAAGDIAAFPGFDGKQARIEHWRLAQQHGQIAARNMLGQGGSASVVPFFWTNQFGVRLDVAGRANGDAEIVFDGDPDADAPTFLAYFLDGDRIGGVAGIKRDKDVIAMMELMQRGDAPTAAEVRAGGVDLLSRL